MDGDRKIGFGEHGERVPVADFDFAAVDPEIQNLRAALDYAKSKVPELLDLVFQILLSENLTAKQLRNRVFFFAFIVRRTRFASQVELARHLGITLMKYAG
jgi:hypothetical protein